MRGVTKLSTWLFTEFRNKTEISDLQSATNRLKTELLRQGLNTPCLAPSLPKPDRNRIWASKGD